MTNRRFFMPKKKSLIRASIEELDTKNAIGQSRFAAKQARREQGEKIWAFSTEQYHSHGTRRTYQEHILHFLNWCRDQHHLTELEHVKSRADELTSLYLRERIKADKSAYTLAAERSALRFFFENRLLANEVVLPQRRREQITRSRRPAVRDLDFQPANWVKEIHFLESTGLRREEALDLRIGQITHHRAEFVTIFVACGKGGKPRTVPVLPGRAHDVLCCIEGRKDPTQAVFARLPSHLDIHAIRRTYAQTLYCHLSGRELPSGKGRLDPKDYDREAASLVSLALGHGDGRIETMMRSYLR
jgi:integrase